MSGKVRAVLFDLDNTLIDRDGAFLEWARWFAHKRLDLRDDVSMGEAIDLIVAMDASGHGAKDALFRRLKQHYPSLTKDVPALVAEFRHQMISHLPALDEGTSRLLDALGRAGIRWGIVTNGSSSQFLRVHKLGLATGASSVVVSEMVGARKPDPLIFRIAAARIYTNPEDILFVGDHPEKDIVGATAAGMQTAWVRRGRTWPSTLATDAPDHTLDSLEDLLSLTWGDDADLLDSAGGGECGRSER